MALLCMSRATSDLVIETQCDWGYSLGVGEWRGASGRFEAEPDPLMGQKWGDIAAVEGGITPESKDVAVVAAGPGASTSG
jgi:hypothetical protein